MSRRYFGRVITVLLAAGFCLSLFFTSNLSALTSVFKIQNIQFEKLSETVEGGVTYFGELNITTNASFHKLKDAVKYIITIKNTDSNDHKINSITDNNESAYLTYEYDPSKNTTVKAGETFDLVVTVKYANAVEDLNKRLQTSNIKFVISYDNHEEANETKDTKTGGTSEIVLTPDTGSNTAQNITSAKITSAAVSIFLALGLVIAILVPMRKYRRFPKRIVGVVIAILALTATVSAKAINAETNSITFTGNYGLADKVAVTYNIDGKEETVVIPYGTKNQKEIPHKAGFTSSGWTYKDGVPFDSETEITEDLTLYTTYTPSAIIANFDGNGLNFSNQKTSNIVEFTRSCHDEPIHTIAHTSNVNDDGSVKKNNYGNDMEYPDGLRDNQIITVPGATKLIVTYKYNLEGGADALYISKGSYNGNIPSPGSGTDFGQLLTISESRPMTTKTVTIDGDTVTFSFYSDSSDGGYGYYATVQGLDADNNPITGPTTICDGAVVSGLYFEPEITGRQVFYGWSLDKNATQADYKNLTEIINRLPGELGETTTIYAIWEERDSLTVKLHGNGLNFPNNSDINTMNFNKECRSEPINPVAYSHTSNVDNAGNSSGNYADSLETKHVVKIDGAASLRITLTYDTESDYDYLYVFDREYDGEVSEDMDAGQYQTYNGGDGTPTTVTLNITGNTVTFAFYSDSSGGYYGYYATVEGLNDSGALLSGETTVCNLNNIAGTYTEPIVTEFQQFKGWASDQNATTPEYTNEKTLLKNISGDHGEVKHFYAIWSNLYFISYNGNGATRGSMSDQIIDSGTTKTLRSNNFIRDNYTFLGWSTDPNATAAEYTNNDEFTAPEGQGSITLYAVWEKNHLLTFNGNGATSGVIYDSYYRRGASIALPSSGYSRTNYTFKGWSTDPDATTATYTGGSRFTIPSDSDKTTFYAVWEKKHHVIFNGNGSTSGSTSDKYYVPGSSVSLPSSGFYRTDYLFAGWSTDPNATTALYRSGQSFLVPTDSEETTLYAIWGIGYTVHYNGNGSTSGSMSDSSMVTGTSITLRNNGFSKSNYVFTGWSEDPDAIIRTYTDKSTYTAPNDGSTEITLYAVWRTKPVVKFDPNGATGNLTSMPNQVFEFNTAAALRTNNFVRSDYEFIGWAETSDATTATYQDKASFTPPMDKDEITLYAVWRPKYIIHYDGNGATSGSMSDQYASWTSSVALRGNSFERPRYYVVGWSANPTATEPTYLDGANFTIPDNSSTEITLYAVWAPAYTFTYNTNASDGSVEGEMNVTNTIPKVGNKTKLYAPNYSREGYGFAGWSTDPDAVDKINTDNPGIYGPNEYVTLTSDHVAKADENREIVLYAVWVPAETNYTLQTFNKDDFSSSKVIALRDERDNNVYAVAKQKNDKWWMIENLRLDFSNPDLNLTVANTNNPPSSFVAKANTYKGRTDTENFFVNCDTDTDACVNSFSFSPINIDRNNPAAPGKKGETSREVSWYAYGVMYNFYTATASYGTLNYLSNNPTPGDICPSGWRLTAGSSSNSTNDFIALGISNGASNNMTIYEKWRKFPINLVESGNVSTNGSTKQAVSRNIAIELRTSSAHNNVYGHKFFFDSYSNNSNYYVYPGTDTSIGPSVGMAIRCIAK